MLRVQDSGCLMSFFFFSSRRRHTRCSRDWSSDVCSSDLMAFTTNGAPRGAPTRPVWASPETGVRTTTDGVVDSLPQARAMATAASENRFIVASPGSRVSCRKTSGRVRGAVRLLDTHPRAAADSAAYARPPTLCARFPVAPRARSEEHTSELQSRLHLVCRLLLEKKTLRTAATLP